MLSTDKLQAPEPSSAYPNEKTAFFSKANPSSQIKMLEWGIIPC
jgi:hypothetical protein